MYLTMVYEVIDGAEAREIVKDDGDKAFFYAVTENAPKFTEDDNEIEECS